MEPRRALALAVTMGGLAIAVVAADVAWGLEVRVQERDEVGWRTVVRNDGDWTWRSECAVGSDLRLALHNDRPVGQTVHYEVTWFDADASRYMEAARGKVRLGAFGSADVDFTLPADAFQDRGPQEADRANVEVRAGGIFVHLCAVEATA